MIFSLKYLKLLNLSKICLLIVSKKVLGKKGTTALSLELNLAEWPFCHEKGLTVKVRESTLDFESSCFSMDTIYLFIHLFIYLLNHFLFAITSLW